MIHFKNIFAVAVLALGVSSAVYAENVNDGKDYKPYPYMFVGIQGGAQTTFTDYNNLKLITPTSSLSLVDSSLPL